VFIGERSAVTSSADFSRASLERLAADTCALARVLAPDPFAGLPDPAMIATTVPEMDLYDPEVAAVGADAAIERAKTAEQAALAADPRITNSEGAEFHASSAQVLYGSSAGFRGSYRSSSTSLSVVPVAVENGSMQRDYWYSSQRKLDRLEAGEVIGRKAAERTLRRLGARSVATCEVPVVFDPEMASGLIRHLAGAVSGNSVYKGVSFLADKLGQKIAPEFVSVIDDGALTDGLASRPFDGEGLSTRRTIVVENGVLRSFLCDTYSARKLKQASTGNASRSVGSAPHVSPTNFLLQPGAVTPEEIISSVKSGLYVTEMIGFGINATTGDYSRGAVGIWIENGELAYPVEEITVAGNLLRMYEQIEVIGNDLELRGSVRAPTLKIARMTVAGRH
jgi:PmbA protein